MCWIRRSVRNFCRRKTAISRRRPKTLWDRTNFMISFLYYLLRFGYEPSKIYRLAKQTFAGEYDGETILKWLKTFCRRFFTQQFKRSCLPDGPKVGTVALSPRGDWRMPSDACMTVWMQDLEQIEE